jgi:hypothetical protein
MVLVQRVVSLTDSEVVATAVEIIGGRASHLQLFHLSARIYFYISSSSDQ